MATTLTERPRMTRAALLAVGLVLGGRILLGAASERTELFRGNTRDNSYVNIEQRVIRRRSARPRVLLIGSSRMRYGVPEKDFAELADLPPRDVENIAVQAGTPLSSVWLLRRNPDLLARVELVIMDVNRQMLREEPVRPRFYRYASMSERLALASMTARTEAVLDWLLRHRADKRTVGEWARGITGLMPKDDFLSIYKDRGLWWHFENGSKADQSLAADNAGWLYMADYEPSASMQAHMNGLLAMLRAREIRCVVMHTPTVQAYRASFTEIPGAAVANHFYMEWLRTLEDRATVLRFDTPESCGLSERHFLDYGHLHRAGARLLTARLVVELKARSLLPRSL